MGIKYDPCNESGVKWLFILYKLSYFKDISIRHTIDFMNTKKNIAPPMIETFFCALETISSCQDFGDIKIHKNLWV